MDNTNMNTHIVNDPLIAPPKGKGYHRWLQTTRKAYVNKQKKLGLTILKAKNLNNINNLNNSNNSNNLNKIWEMINKNGVLIICESKNNTNTKNNKFLKNKKFDKILFNNQIFIIYRKTPIKKRKKKKTYLILSKYLGNLSSYFPKDWGEAQKNTKVIDLFYADSIFISDKSLYTLKSNIYSKGDYGKGSIMDFNDKGLLHTFVKKDNPKIFNKYFMDQYTINTIDNLDKLGDLFKKHKYWMVKPEPGGKGFGIKLYDKLNNVQKYIKLFNNTWYGKKVTKWVLQKYINNPLLIPKTNKKFHLRFIYLLTHLNGKFKCYLFKNGCFYPANKEFTLNTLNLSVHMTHGSNTETSEKAFYPEYFDKMFGKKKTNKTLKDIINIFKYITSVIKYKCWSNNKNCFHFVGADIMMTDKFETKLIELNMEPGLRPFMWFPKMGEIFQEELIDIILNNGKNIKDFIEL